jgi:alkyl hydroperoxide reductase subunit AhpC
MITQPAPEFSLPAIASGETASRVVSSRDFCGHWLLLLFYPRDFSFVCPTELTSFSARIIDFERRNCRMLGISVDSIASHQEWLKTPPSAGGLGRLQFPLASDANGNLARQYGIWLPESGACARGLFLIDPEGILQYSVVHNLSVGRSVDEILRVLDALESGGLCPASWTAADGTLDPEQALQPGRVLGHYKIRRLLGKGTFGSVFAGWDLRLERDVALKVLRRNTAQSRDDVLREARAAAALNHPNVCAIYAVEEIDGLPVIVFEHIDGRPLADVIAASPSPDAKLKLATGIALGLVAAHARNLVHGDLKPGNVLVDRHGTPRILDFGLARRVWNLNDEPPREDKAGQIVSAGDSGDSADAGATVIIGSTDPSAPTERPHRGISGTPAYMAPELWSGIVPTPASDVFAFGLLFFEILTGRRALSEKTPLRLAAEVRDPQLAAALSAQLPAQFHSLLSGTLANDAAQRPTMPEVCDFLQRLND